MAQQTILDTMAIGEVDQKGFVEDSVRDEFFKKFRAQTDNRTCLDCPNRNPTWISLSHGTFVCLECSGEHRRKGVHISFVRSADMDKFTVDQLAMMAIGGNAKAREYFKKHGMGRTTETGKPIAYTSNAALKYRQQIEHDAQLLCKRIGVQHKPSAAAAETKQTPQPAASLVSNDFFDDALKDTTPSAPKAVAPKAFGVPKAAVPKSFTEPAPAPQGPSVTVVRKAEPASVPKQSLGGFPASSAPKAKQAAKVIDFDFDFDEIESCANAPPPAPTPAPARTPAPAVPQQVAPMQQPSGYPKQEAMARAPAPDRFAGRKALSSDDFFNDNESAAQERETRYNQFASSGAISSDAFFRRAEVPKQEQEGTVLGFMSRLAETAGDYLDNMKSQGNSGNPMSDAIGGYMNRRSQF